MDNIFTTLKGDIEASAPAEAPNAAEAAQQNREPADYRRMTSKALVAAWQKDGTDELTSAVLKRMQPTIDAAMTSYAPGMDNQLAVKAAKLTLQTLKSYDPSYGADPGTYLFHNLKRLSRYGMKAGSIIPQPEGLLAERRRVTQARDKFIDTKEREPSMAELADLTGISVKRLDTVLNGPVVVSESSTLSEDTQRDTMSSSALTDDDCFEYVYASVSPVDQKIMEWMSGRHGHEVLSNNAIAARLKVSPAAVSQHKSHIQKLLSDVRSLL